MKRSVCALFALVLLPLSLFAAGGLAADAIPAQVEALFQEAFPGGAVTHFDQCGYTAAAVLSDGDTQMLCLAQEKDGAWALVAANPSALRQDETLSGLYLDTDETLFWSYHEDGAPYETYHAVCSGDQWRVVSLMSSQSHGNGSITEHHIGYSEGRLEYATYLCDENENILSSHAYTPVPALWLDGLMALSAYDDSLFPKPNADYTDSWLPEEATALAAAELFPGDAFLGGCASRDHLQFFLQTPDGEKVLALCTLDERDGWFISRSSPLPQQTQYGRENFSSSLVIGDLLVSVGPVAPRAFGITLIYNTAPDAPGECMFSLGQNWITGEVPNGYDSCFGDHPWDDVAAVDWNALPHSLEEALSRMDSSQWAVVRNPNPADRLHLRVRPDRGAASLGKYYNGTPVRILEQKGDWVRVDIFGVTGFMMKSYLAFGDAGRQVEAVFPSRMAVESIRDHFVYASPEDDLPIANFQNGAPYLLVLSVVGNEWYHVWFPQENLTGYVPQGDWWEGNG